MIHHLKTWPKADRPFAVGDRLLLNEWDPASKTFTGACQMVDVTYLSAPGTWGLPPDLCVMSILRPA